MIALEQRSLLLRQLAALRRSGVPHDRALELASSGLRPGPLADRVDAARRALAAGDVPGEGADPVERLLGRGTAPVETLDHAAGALDARLAAAEAMTTARIYFGIALVGPLVIGAMLGWAAPLATVTQDGPLSVWSSVFGGWGGYESDPMPATWSAAIGLLAVLKYVGLPLAALVLILLRTLPAALAPGVRRIRRAAALYDAAASGGNPAAVLDHLMERAYFEARRPTAGSEQAAAELAEELVREADVALMLFRHLAPVVAAMVIFLLSWGVTVVLGAPVLRVTGL